MGRITMLQGERAHRPSLRKGAPRRDNSMVSLPSDRQTRATEIYNTVKTRLPGERDSFAAGACGEDDVLFAMVKDLMSSSDVESDTGATRVLEGTPGAIPSAFA